MPMASIVVPVYNAARTIKKCLESLVSQTFEDYEIIVVDNGSNDGSFSLIDKFIKDHPEREIKLIKEEKRGPSEARNKGIKYSSGEIVAFTDSDCVADSKWLQNIIGAFDDEKIGAVAGNIRGYNPSNLIEKFLCIFTLRGLEEERIFSEYTLFEGGFPTANLAVRKNLLKEIGGFQSLKYGEDHDLCARLYGLGFKISYTMNVMIYHIHRGNFGGLVRQSFGFGQAHAMLLQKWGNHKLIIDFPKYTYRHSKFVFPAWINLNYADKKMGLLMIPTFFNSTLFLLPVLYLLYLSVDMKKKCRNQGIKISVLGQFGLAFLLLVKSLSMTCGRICGSFKNQVICI